jgi:hypothetical protein
VIHSFAVVISGADLTSPDTPDADTVYEADCDDALLTRDAARYRTYFPSVALVAP